MLIDPQENPKVKKTLVLSVEDYISNKPKGLEIANEFYIQDETSPEALLVNLANHLHVKIFVNEFGTETDWYLAEPSEIISTLHKLMNRKSTMELSQGFDLLSQREYLNPRRRSLSVSEYDKMFSSQPSQPSEPSDLEQEESGSDSIEELLARESEVIIDFNAVKSPTVPRKASLSRSDSQSDSMSAFLFVGKDDNYLSGSGSQEDLSQYNQGTDNIRVDKFPLTKPKRNSLGSGNRPRSDSRLGTFLPIPNESKAEEKTALIQQTQEGNNFIEKYYACKGRVQGSIIIIILIAILLSLWYIIWVSSGTWHPFG